MSMRTKLYTWNRNWMPKGAKTDTPPGSAQRRLLDILTNPAGKYKISPGKIDISYQIGRGKWKSGESKDNVYRFAEAMEFIEQSPGGWKKFRPALDKIGLIDPLDPRNIREDVKKRMEKIRAGVEKQIGLTPDDSEYCDAFVPKFYKQGKPPFNKGGLCFDYSKEINTKDLPIEGTAGQAFQACIDDKNEWGLCTESTFKILSSFEYLMSPCNVYGVATDYQINPGGHIFVEYGGHGMDPSGIGRTETRGIYTTVTRRQLIGIYYSNLTFDLASSKSGDTKDPFSTATMAALINPDDPASHIALGSAFENKGNIDGAIKEYRHALELRQTSVAARIYLSEALEEKGDTEESLKERRKALEVGEKYPELKEAVPKGRYDLGKDLYDQGKIDQAILEFEKAISLKSDYPKARFALGRALYDKGRLDTAIKHYQEALKQKKSAPEIHYHLGHSLFFKGDLNGAMNAYQSAIKLRKDYPEAYVMLGAVFFMKGNFNDAIEQYEEAIELNENCAQAHYGLGTALYEKEKPDEALKEYKKALEINKNYPQAHYGMGVVLKSKGDKAGAKKHFKRAKVLSKDRKKAR